MAEVLTCKPGELVFTSGGTESNNLAIGGAARRSEARGRHLITSAIEHHSVLNCFEHLARRENFKLTVLPVDDQGVVNPDSLRQSIRADTSLVSVMAANNETGVLQPFVDLGEICRENGVLFHTDAAQYLGKLPVSSIADFHADLVTFCAHKFHGPKGIGLLYVKSPLRLAPALHGGSQEDERRPGTENLASILGLTLALELSSTSPVFSSASLGPMISRLETLPTLIDGIEIIGQRMPRLPNTVSFTIQNCDNAAMIAAMDLEGVCVSGGSACSTGALLPSHVLLAMGRSLTEARSFLRLSLGRENNIEEVDRVLAVMPNLIRRIRAANILGFSGE